MLARVETARSSLDGDVSGLVQRAREGDELAFAELYVGFFDRVYRYLVVALKNPDDAQEVAQEVFVRALSMLDRFEPNRGQFRDWLFSMVRSLAIDHLRRRHAATIDPHAVPQRPVTTEERATSLLERLDPEAGVRDLIGVLPEPQRRVIALRFVFRLSTSEIADALGVTAATVRQLQHRGLKTLAARMAEDVRRSAA